MENNLENNDQGFMSNFHLWQDGVIPIYQHNNIPSNLICLISDIQPTVSKMDRPVQWFRTQTERLQLTENTHYIFFTHTFIKTRKGAPTKDCAVTLEAAKILILKSETKQSLDLAWYLIEAEKKLTQILQQPKQISLSDIENLGAPRLAVMVVEAAQKIVLLETRIEEDKPKVNFYNKAVEHNEGNLKISEVQKNIRWTLQGSKTPLGPNSFRKILRGEWIGLEEIHYYSKKNNLDEPLQKYMQAGKEYFEIKLESTTNGLVNVIYVTPYGIHQLLIELREYGILPWDEIGK